MTALFLPLSDVDTSFAKFCLQFKNSCDVFVSCYAGHNCSQPYVCTITHNTLHFDRLLPGNWHCAASRKVVGSITDGVIGIFH